MCFCIAKILACWKIFNTYHISCQISKCPYLQYKITWTIFQPVDLWWTNLNLVFFSNVEFGGGFLCFPLNLGIYESKSKLHSWFWKAHYLFRIGKNLIWCQTKLLISLIEPWVGIKLIISGNSGNRTSYS